MHWIKLQEKVNEESYNYMTNLCILESVHPIDIINNYEDVMTEAAVKAKNMNNILPNIHQHIINAIKKFNDITNKLKRENAVWIREARKFNINNAKLDDFDYEIYPYWRGQKLYTNQVVSFKDEDSSLYDNPKEFMTKYYSDIMDDEGKVSKDKLRGLTNTNTKKITIKENDVRSKYNMMLQNLNNICNLRDEISFAFEKVAKIVKQYSGIRVTINESTLLDMSLFKDEYFDILMESIMSLNEDNNVMDNSNDKPTKINVNTVNTNKNSGGITTEQIEKEADQNNNNNKKDGININKDENAENKQKVNKAKSAIAWAKIMCNIFTSQMDILDEMYDEYVKFVKTVMGK